MTASALAGLGTLVALMSAVWAASVVRRDVSIVDIWWSLAIFASACVYASAADELTARRITVLTAVGLWSIRLAGYLAWRGWGAGEDRRYTAMRARRPRFVLSSLFVVFWLQAALAWVVSLPLLAVMQMQPPEAFRLLDVTGALLFAVGFGFENARRLADGPVQGGPGEPGQGLQPGASGAARGIPTISARPSSGGACGASPAPSPVRSGQSSARCF